MIGLGVISRYYWRALELSPELSLVAVCDRDSSKLDDARRLGLWAADDFRELLARSDVDAVVINLPNDLHYLACKEALRAGKHVCCEKPLTLDVAQARELVGLARRQGRTLLTAFHRRYNANVLAARDTVGRRRIVRAVAHYLERIEEHCGQDRWYLDPKRSGGGCIADNGPNALDALSLFLGRLHLDACWIEQRREGVDLSARLQVSGERGESADVLLDWTYPGEKKTIEFHLADGSTVRADMLGGFAGFKSSLEHEYEGVLADFAARIGAGDCFGEQGLAVVELIAEAYRLAADPADERKEGAA
jgi:predicted dehydrogenase